MADQYNSGPYGEGPYAGIAQQNKFITTSVSNFQADADKERIILSWDSIERSVSFTALRVIGNDIHVAGTASSDDLTQSSTTDTTFTIGSGYSTIDDDYVGLNLVSLAGKNVIGNYKQIKSYDAALGKFVIDKVEYPDNLGGKLFGLSQVENLIYDSNIYPESTITYNTTGSNVVSSYNRDFRSFTVEGTLDLDPGELFTLNTAYYPKLYTSRDNGVTYDDGQDLTYTVGATATPTTIDSNVLYNRFTASTSDLFNDTDVDFYNGSYLTFITGQNKGFSRKILDFNIFTREIITEYFDNEINNSDIFSINIHSTPLVNHLEDYRFKILFWNNDSTTPIYGKENEIQVSESLREYQTTLDNNYWDVNVNTNVYTTIESLSRGGHSKADRELDLQRTDFSAEQVRDIKLENNFGSLVSLPKNPNIPFVRYRKRILDTLQGMRNGSTYEGLFNIARAFTTLTPTVEFLSVTGWRLGARRLGYPNNVTYTTVTSGDSTSSYDTFTVDVSGSLSDTDFITFTNAPSGSEFDLNLIGKFLPITTVTPVSGSINNITISPIGSPIPTGADVTIFKPNTFTNYATVPYSNLAFLFGIRIFIYGPLLDDDDKVALENLLKSVIPLHVRYFIVYTSDFVGETSLWEFRGDFTALDTNYELQSVQPNEELINEPGSKKDSIVATVETVIDTSNTFAVSGSTITENYYKDKNAKFTTGNNAGISRVITDYHRGTGQIITEDFPYTIQVGDECELEKIRYQTKYTTKLLDLKYTNFTSSKLTAAWYARKVDPEIEEKVYITFSDDAETFTPNRELYQNEQLNELVSATVAGSGTTTTFATSGGATQLSSIDDFYTRGFIKFIDGDNTNLTNEILSYDGITKTFTTETFDYAVQDSDTFVILLTDAKRYFKLTMYHNNVASKDDVEIESLAIKLS